MHLHAAQSEAPRAYAELAMRCLQLGLPTWWCDESGVIRSEPQSPDACSISDRVGSEARHALGNAAPAPVQLAADQWLLPVPLIKNKRRHGITMALATGSAASANQLYAMLQWMSADIAQASFDRDTLDQFGDRLTWAYEETQALHALAGQARVTAEPLPPVERMMEETHEILPFAWIALAFADTRCLPDLQDRVLLNGQLPCSQAELHREARKLLQQDWNGEVTQLLEAGTDLVRLTGADAIANAILHDDQVIAVLLAGNKQVEDSDVTSFEFQFLRAAADVLGAFLSNVSRFAEQREMFFGTLQALSAAIDAKDCYTCGHTQRVSWLSCQLAKAMGLSTHDVEQLRIAGLMHDIGKIGIAEAILCKPGRLTDAEMAQIRLHPVIGCDILRGIPPMAPMLPGVLYHHERWDGSGYPERLAGEAIPLMARIIGVADTIDAMTSTRSYRQKMPLATALAEVRAGAGTQFDVNVIKAVDAVDWDAYQALLEEHRERAMSGKAA